MSNRDQLKQYNLIWPKTVTVPLLFAVPHSGRDYPDDMRRRTRLPETILRSSEDAYVDQFFDFAPEAGAPLLIATIARAYVDLNRAGDELDTQMFEALPENLDVKPRATHRVKAGLGVIPKRVNHMTQIYDQRLPAEAILQRLDKYYHPYHQTLQSALQRLRNQFGWALLVDCHSMPSPEPVLGFKRPWPDIIIGDAWGEACNSSLTGRVETLLRKNSFSVRRNVPYAGGFSTLNYGQPANNIHALQIEINRALYLNEKDIEKNARFEAVKDRLVKTFLSLMAHVTDQKQAAE